MMMETLQGMDAALFTMLNSCHNAYFDNFMWLVAGKLAWVIMVLALLWTLRDKGWRTALLTVLAVALVIALADQVSSGMIKPLVQRLRPSHNPDLADTIHVVNGYYGGRYGFVSSHAANSFGVAVLLAVLFRNRWLTCAMMCWAVLVSYCRIYLGVHYPGDIVCGALVGVAAGLIVPWLWRKAECRNARWAVVRFGQKDANVVTAAVVTNVLILAVVSASGAFA